MIRIENKKDYRGSGEYIGRPSVLGNPYKIGLDGNREQVIEKYRSWLRSQYRKGREHKQAGMIDSRPALIYDELLRLVELSKQGDLVLICWCHPQRCHGDVIRDAIIGIAKMS